MRPKRLIGESSPSPEMPDYTERLLTMAEEIGVPEDALTERGINLTVNLLARMRRDYGDPSTETYKPYHNDNHGVDFIRYFWTLWTPLHRQFPETFDTEGFELGMIMGGGHDIINDTEAARENPGQNEEASAFLVSDLMLAAGYQESSARRVFNGILKTTVRRNEDGVIVQTKMREGSKDILGLCAGQADMYGILIDGPSALFGAAYRVWLENSQTPLKDALSKPQSVGNFLIEEKQYLGDRVAALSGDLKYYVADEAKREAIIQVYRNEVGGASLRALEAVDRLHHAPERTREMVDEAFSVASRVARRGLEQILAAERHMWSQIRHGRRDTD